MPAGQDPQVALIDGVYYYCESSPQGIFLRATPDFRQLADKPPRRVWSPPRSGPMSRNLWAPELHVIAGRCYIYFAADDGQNANHRMWVLVSKGASPCGPYRLAGPLETDGWAIDGTTFTDERGERYLVWSGWPDTSDGRQNLYLARMATPTRLTGRRVLLAEPDQPWERHGLPLLEGPQVLQRGGRTMLVYSASGSWTQHYGLGLLVLDGPDVLNPAAWRKTGQIFRANEHGWGVGHCGFVTASDGSDWMLYHSKTTRQDGWGDREVRTQPFAWSSEGLPVLGAPVPRGVIPMRPDSAADGAMLRRHAA